MPGDISVAGYDNTMFAAFDPISPTTVDQAGREIGANAAQLLIARITDRERRSTQVTLSPTLVREVSTLTPARLIADRPAEERVSAATRTPGRVPGR